jgi:plastocyanin
MGFAAKRVLPVVVLMLAIGVAAPSHGATTHASAAKRVTIKDDFFKPKTVHVGVGGKVTWSWRGDGDEHNVTFRKVPKGASKRHSRTHTGGSFTRSFTKRGTYRYVCTIHEDLGMRGTVVAG